MQTVIALTTSRPGFVVQHAVQQAVRPIYNRSKKQCGIHYSPLHRLAANPQQNSATCCTAISKTYNKSQAVLQATANRNNGVTPQRG